MFLVRAPISLGLGLLARKGAEQLNAVFLSRVSGVPGNERPDARDLTIKLRYVLLAAAFEAVVFAVTKTLADRGTQKVALAIAGKSES